MAFYIGYENLLTTTGVTVTFSTETVGYEAANAYDGFGYDWWLPTATGDSFIKASFAAVQTCDYMAIWGHDLSDHTSTYKLQHSDDDVTYTDAFTAITPTTNNTIFKSFVSSSHKYWKVVINNPVTIASIAGVQFGDRMEMPHGAEVGFAVPTIAPKVELKTARSESGAFIGGRQLSLGVEGSINFTNIDPAFIRATLKPFITHAQTPAVFVMQWDSITYTDEIVLAWLKSEVKSPTYSSPLYMDFSIDYEGTL